MSQIDFDSLRAKFDKGRKATEAQKLRGAIALKLTRMVRLNRTRIDFLQEFQKMIDEYNSGAANIETWFAKLTAFAQRLSDEEKRGEEREVKKVAKQRLETLKREKLVLDWKKRQATRAAVRYAIETGTLRCGGSCPECGGRPAKFAITPRQTRSS